MQKRKGPRPAGRVILMSKASKNAEIEKQVKRRIKKLGYGNRLVMDPIPNTFKRRNHFTRTANGTCVFTAFMWQLNSLEGKELKKEIDRRILEAANYFGLQKE